MSTQTSSTVGSSSSNNHRSSKGTKDDVVIATYTSGVTKTMPWIVIGTAALTVVYTILVFAVPHFPHQYLGMPPPAAEYCSNNNNNSTECYRPDLFAFQMSSYLAILMCASVGFYSWHISKRVHTLLPSTPEGRLFGYLPEAEFLASMNFTFQFWDFWISLIIPEHRTAIMLTHHLMASTVSWCSIRYQYLHYYGIFFLGLSEVSSIFLVFVDLAKFFPPVPGTIYDQFVGLLCGPLFVLSFIFYRVLYWWPVSYQLFHDAFTVLKSGQANKLRPGCSWVLYLFLGLNLPLGVLQLYWLTIIYQEAKKVILPAA